MLCAIFLFFASTSALIAERQALCTLAEAIPYLQTVGWKNCAQMNDALSLARFQGLGLNWDGKQVLGIQLSGSQCRGSLPDVFSRFHALATLAISVTSLTGTLPASVGQASTTLIIDRNPTLSGTLPSLATTLATLVVRSTQISGTLPESLAQMKELDSLTIKDTLISGTAPRLELLESLISTELTGNELSGALPPILPVNLRSLSLARNKIVGTIPREYFGQRNLQTLALEGNRLSGIIPAVVSRLQTLTLANNTLSGTIPGELFSGSLVDVDLSGNQLEGVLPLALFATATSSLLRLDLSRNALEGTLPEVTTGLSRLTLFNLARNRFRGEIPAKLFSSMRSMVRISLHDNAFNGTLQGMVGARYFALLSVANNRLSGSIPENYFNGASFETLDLSGNSFTECGPLEPSVTKSCAFGGGFFSGCSPRYALCSLSFLNNCAVGSGYYGPTCRRCNCTTGLVCKDGAAGDGTCEGFNPCRNHTCEGICNINGNSYVCSCPFPAIINSTDQRSCDCPFGFTKNERGGGCSPCPKIDNCLAYASCTSCSVCAPGYALSSAGQCALNKDCLFSDWTAWSACDRCDGGLSLRYRNLSEKNTALPFYCQEFLYNRTTCGYPCIETTLTSKDAILGYLHRSFTQWNWLASVTNSSSLAVEKTADYLLLSPPVDEEFLMQKMSEMLPLVNSSRYFIESDGNATRLEVLAEEEKSITGVVAGAVIGVAVPALLLAFFLLRRRQKKWLFDLPDELQRHFHAKGSGWVTEGSCKMKEIPLDDAHFRSIWDVLATKQIPVASVYAVCNPMLGASFSNYRSILRQRMTDNPVLFCKQDWRLRSEKSGLRGYVHERYLQLAEYFPWNDPEETVPILACLHATDFEIAKSIASKGFCALATLDEGFYGKGIYFSTYGSYVAPYFTGKERPAVLINLVIGGNAFPVVEGPNDLNNFLGKPTASGYQSHFVLTKSDGAPVVAEHSEDESNELVISQEAQVVPIYIVCVSAGCKLGDFSRTTSSLLTPLLVEDGR